MFIILKMEIFVLPFMKNYHNKTDNKINVFLILLNGITNVRTRIFI